MGSAGVWSLAGAGLVLLLLVVGLSALFIARRRILQLRAGGIDVALRTRTGEGARGWHLGVAQYRGEEFTWYRVLSLRSGPNWMINRGDVEITARREPSLAESYTLPQASTVLHLTRQNGLELEVAMGADALTGFLSWLESAPPGHSVPWAS
ncbi:MAG: DUF2550 domain-containing protein [Saccharopolyspora sp.]|uniref:DUF2550 domain-containing protein n=1 Tax=Saccharopolyspora TaxID=1835 RepID=UPI00190C4AE6|nr:DUF2550 domain-containing protein [Saccharopolyspora sp.]MBK0867630.1 DUF2550 domain-containing protein [Saccharopolyspora sp. HNM0986]MBQ6642880.1 DUF2550 domain-containing protein [Saccharopolyspora sp.]